MADELIVPLPNGGTLRCGPGEGRAWGGSLQICDADGNEVLYWTASEWAEEPELVIGAVFSAALKPLAELTADRVLAGGAWIYRRAGPAEGEVSDG